MKELAILKKQKASIGMYGESGGETLRESGQGPDHFKAQ